MDAHKCRTRALWTARGRVIHRWSGRRPAIQTPIEGPGDISAGGQARGMSPARRYVPALPPVFVGSEALKDGLLTRGQLGGPAVRRVLRGVYRLASTPDSHELRCLAACLLLPAPAVLTGVSAATVLGVPLASVADDVRIVTPEGLTVPRRRGIHVTEATRRFTVVSRPDGLRLADRER